MSDLIPEGRYTAVATRVADEEGNDDIARFALTSGGTKQVLVYFRILEGEYAGQNYPWFGFWTEKTWMRTVVALKYCGMMGDDLLAIAGQELDQKVQVVIGHNEWTNDDGVTRTSARVEWVNRLGSGAIKLNNPMGEADLRKFAAQMRTMVAGVADFDGERVEGASPAPNEADDPGPSETDDIPF